MNRRQLTTLAAVLTGSLAGFGSAAQAQGDKTIRILVGFPPGGSSLGTESRFRRP